MQATSKSSTRRIFRLGCPEVRLDDVFWHGCKCCHLDSCQTLPLPSKHTLRCTKCCACHDFGNGISKVLRLSRFRAPRAARATTSQPFRQLPNAAPATQTHAQMRRMLRLPRLRQWHLQSAAPATISRARAARATTSQPFRQLPNAAPATQTHTQMHRMLRLPRLRQWHLQSAAPATISRAPSRARDNIPAL